MGSSEIELNEPIVIPIGSPSRAVTAVTPVG
jgi:hypothetical protein